MRRVLRSLAALSLFAAPSSSAARSAKRVSCAKVSYETNGGYYDYVSSKIRGTRVHCATARRVAHVKPERVSGTGAAPRRFTSSKFACKGTARKDAKGRKRVAFRCTRGRSTIWFTWAPQ